MTESGIPIYLFRAIRFQNPDKQALRNITAIEWEHILSNWQTARIMVSFCQDHGDELPDWVRRRIDQYLADTATRFQRIKHTYSAAANAFAKVDADHLVLKGFSLFPGYADHPQFRPQGDIDLYCPAESISRAQDALSSLGYIPNLQQEHRTKDHLCTMMPNVDWGPRANIFDPEMPIGFELHFCLWNEPAMRFSPSGLENFWTRRVEQQIDDLSFPALHPVDNLGYTALNVLRDLLRGLPSIEQVYGLARFLQTQANDGAFWKKWRELHDPSLRRLEAISFQLATDWFDCQLSAEVQEETDRFPTPIRAWFSESSKSGLYPRFGQTMDGIWLHMLLLDSVTDKVHALRARLFATGIPPQVAGSKAKSDPPAKGWKKLSKCCRRLVGYSAWFVSRSAVRLPKVPSFLLHGFRLWFSTMNLSKEFWSFFTASFFFDLGMYIFFVLYNLYLLDRGFKENFLGLVASASALGGIAGTIPAGLLAQRFGLRKALLFCLTLVPLIFASRSIFADKTLLLALSFLGGLVVTIWAVCISPAIAQLTTEKSRPIGFSTIFSSGIAIGMLGGQAGGRLPGWIGTIAPAATAGRTMQAALLIACGLVAVALWPISRVKFSSPPSYDRKLYPSSRFLARYLPAIAVWTLAIGAFDPFFNAYFSQYLHMPLQQIGSVYSYAHLSQVLAILVSPMMFRKFGIVTGIMYIQIGAAVALGFLAACSRVPAATFVYVGYMALQWMTEPGMFLLLMNRVSPSERTGASALNFLAINISGSIATAVSGASFAKFGYPLVLMVTSTVALAAAFFFRLMLGKDEQVPDAGLSSASIA